MENFEDDCWRDVIPPKERASAFFGTPLIAHLTRLQADSLIVCGESTSGCEPPSSMLIPTEFTRSSSRSVVSTAV